MVNPRRAPAFRAIGVEAILRLAGRRRLVVIAPHPDDETLGCGDLIARAARRGTATALIALTDGDASHPESRRFPPAALGRLRSGEARRALARLGAGGIAVRRLCWRDGHVAVDGHVGRLRRQLAMLRAGVVLVTSDADHHPDHRAAARIALAAARGLGLPVIHYAVWSRVAAPIGRRGRCRGAKRWATGAFRSQITPYIDDAATGFRFDPAALAKLIHGAERFEAVHRTNRHARPRPCDRNPT